MFCIHCGKQIEDMAAFCTICGKKQEPTVQVIEVAADIAVVPQNQTATGYAELVRTNENLKEVRCFEGLFAEIAVSSNGYIAIYHPNQPQTKKRAEQPEWLELCHISQINDFDIEVDDVEKTKVKSGFGGVQVGIFTLGGGSGKVKTTTTVRSVDLILNTKDFNNPQIRVRLYNGGFGALKAANQGGFGLGASIEKLKTLNEYGNPWPPALYLHFSKAWGLSKEGRQLLKEKYNNGFPNEPVIQQLQVSLQQMLAAQQQSEFAAAAAPQLSSADELAKFKGLLDSGVITQEEYEQKKRQLLGL